MCHSVLLMHYSLNLLLKLDIHSLIDWTALGKLSYPILSTYVLFDI